MSWWIPYIHRPFKTPMHKYMHTSTHTYTHYGLCERWVWNWKLLAKLWQLCADKLTQATELRLLWIAPGVLIASPQTARTTCSLVCSPWGKCHGSILFFFFIYLTNQSAHFTHRGFWSITDELFTSTPVFVLVYKDQECVACAQSWRIWHADIFFFSPPSQNTPLTLSPLSQHFF